MKIDFAKFLIFLLTFILLSILITFVVIIPNIKEYKSSKSEYKKNYLLSSYIQKDFEEVKSKLKKFNSDNKKVLSALSNEFIESDFVVNTEKFFDLVVLKKETSSKNKEFNIYDLNITMSMKTPQKFYDFIEDLSRYKNIIQLDFPILMQSNGDMINTFFKIKVFNIVR